MSGQPNSEGISSLKFHLEKLSEANYGIEVAKEAVVTANDQLEKYKRQQRESLEEIERLMQSMDVASPGNSGYQDRLLRLLVGLTENKR